MSCFKCNKPTCEEPICKECVKASCNNCEDAIGSNCVIIDKKLTCVNGGFYLAEDLNLNDTLMALICKINELEAKIQYIQTNCCPSTTCEIIQITNLG